MNGKNNNVHTLNRLIDKKLDLSILDTRQLVSVKVV